MPADASTAPTQSKPTPMPKGARTAFRALHEAVGEVGQAAPASNHIPQNITVTTIDQWRTYAYRMGISATDSKERAKQTAFKRAIDNLIGSGAVGYWEPYVWPVAR